MARLGIRLHFQTQRKMHPFKRAVDTWYRQSPMLLRAGNTLTSSQRL
jgi:hypothetical protein